MSRRKRRAVLVLTAASAAVAAMLWSVPSRWAARREWKKGLAAAAAEDFGGAEAAFKACLAARPTDADCAAAQAMASRINRSWTRFQPAEPAGGYADRSAPPTSLERANPETPGDSPSELAGRYAKKGLEHVDRGEYPQALEAFRACINLDPANPACLAGFRLYGSLASSALKGGAAQAVPSAVTTEDDMKRAVMHWNEGIKAFQKGDMSSARDQWALCRKFDAGNTDCASGLSRLDQSFGGGQ